MSLDFAAQSLDAALQRLTATQREIVDAEDRRLCILAGAGSGKTRVLTLRVARRCATEQVDPRHVAVMTFSRKAASELRSRLWSLGVRDVAAHTIHRWALNLVNDHRTVTSRPAVQVLGDRRRFLRELDRERRTTLPAATVDLEVGWAKSRGLTPQNYAAAASTARRRTPAPPEQVAEAFAAYEAARRRRGVLDLDDLLLEATAAIQHDERFAASVHWQLRHLSVDECQDLNPAQRDLLIALAGSDPDLVLVGDPNQAIYGWNGAEPSCWLDLAARWPDMRELRLPDNHRSTEAICAFSAAALGDHSAPPARRVGGVLPQIISYPSVDAEAASIANLVNQLHRPGTAWSNVAVLARTNAQLQTFAAALEAAGTPYFIAGSDLLPGSDLTAGPARTEAVATATGTIDGVVLSSFHRAKGLEWETVLVAGVAEGLVPHSAARTPEAQAEERRLLYVALSRATDQLVVTWAPSVDLRGRPRGASPWLGDLERCLERLRATRRPLDRAARLEVLAALQANLHQLREGT